PPLGGAGDEIVGPVVGQQLGHEGRPGPRRAERPLLHFQDRAHVPEPHGLNHVGEGVLLRASHFRSASDFRRYTGVSVAGSPASPRASFSAPSTATAPLRSTSKPAGASRARPPARRRMASP